MTETAKSPSAPGRVPVTLDELRRTVDAALRQLGLSGDDAAVIGEILIWGEMRGSSQGLYKILERTVLPGADAAPIGVSWPRPAVARIDGARQVGMVVMRRAADLVADAADAHGLAAAGTWNTASSSGAIGFYARRIAERGHLGIVMAGSPKSMALHGGHRPVMGTNPVAFAIPLGDEILAFDMSTSMVTVFSLVAARERGEVLPAGLAVDEHGRPTTDPARALAGAILPFGGHKGSGLALMIEILTGPLQGASIFGDERDNRGNFLLALDPQAFIGRAAFEAAATLLLQRLRGAQGDDAPPPRLPGEAGEARARQVLADGSLGLDAPLWASLQALAGGAPVQ
ncbi:MAG: Ldh family oxidoreductase [Burkholderiaceae bacterium]